jgi:2-hydroxychromene-2-carboxylate isomerase
VRLKKPDDDLLEAEIRGQGAEVRPVGVSTKETAEVRLVDQVFVDGVLSGLHRARVPGQSFAKERAVRRLPRSFGVGCHGADRTTPRGEITASPEPYAYMDCRREAARRGLVIRGPRKIYDSSIAQIGFLWAARAGRIRPYHDRVFEKFWKRALDIEDPAAIRAELAAAAIDDAGFVAFVAGEGRALHNRLRVEAEAKGVFGVPSYLVDDELFWGGERIERVRERLLGPIR